MDTPIVSAAGTRPAPSLVFSISNTYRAVQCTDCGDGISGPRPAFTLEQQDQFVANHDCDAHRVHDVDQAHELALAGVGMGEGQWTAPDIDDVYGAYEADDEVVVLDEGRVADVDQAHAAAFAEKETRERHRQVVAGLRATADLVELVPELAKRVGFHALSAHFGPDEEPAPLFARFIRAALDLGFTIDKDYNGDYAMVVAKRSDFKVTLQTYREQVCEKVVTGVETVTEEVPDPEALAAVPTITQTREVETFRWECKPLLAAAAPCPCGRGPNCGCGLAGELASAGTQVAR